MSHPNNPPPGANQPVKLQFKNPASMYAFMLIDRAVGDLSMAMSQLSAIGRPDLMQQVQSHWLQLQRQRDEVLRIDQGGIVIAGPGDLPPSRA